MYQNAHSTHIMIIKSWKRVKCPTTEQISKLCYSLAMKFFTAMERNAVQLHAET